MRSASASRGQKLCTSNEFLALEKSSPQRLDAGRHQAQLPRRAEKIKGVRAAARLSRSNVDQCSVASYQTPQLAECFDQIVEFALLYDHGSCPNFDLDLLD